MTDNPYPVVNEPGQPRLLLVEDDDDGAESLLAILGAGGYEVERAANGRAAMRALRDRKFDLVITDIVMPEEDGMYLLRMRGEIAPGVPMMAISGGGVLLRGLDLTKLAGLLGADASLAKPINPDELLATVRELLARSRPDAG